MSENDDLSEGSIENAEAGLPNYKATVVAQQSEYQRYILVFSGLVTLLYLVGFSVLFGQITILLAKGDLLKADFHFFLFVSILALIPAWMTSRLLNSVFPKADADSKEITPLSGVVRHFTDSTHH